MWTNPVQMVGPDGSQPGGAQRTRRITRRCSNNPTRIPEVLNPEVLKEPDAWCNPEVLKEPDAWCGHDSPVIQRISWRFGCLGEDLPGIHQTSWIEEEL
jgi:hypothetical protein